MIVSPQEYASLLQDLTSPNLFADMIQIPNDEHIYDAHAQYEKDQLKKKEGLN